jgi:hypothetical protein
MSAFARACPFVARECLLDGCLAWSGDCCRLIPQNAASHEAVGLGAFEQKLQGAAPLMYRSLLDLVRMLEETSRDCPRCGPELYSHAQQLRSCLLDELISAELAEVGIKADKSENSQR